jgi:predicted transport protein
MILETKGSNLKVVPRTEFKKEKDLQTLLEENLEEVFGCRFVSSEFRTGTAHGGRIDTLALSEDNNPVIIEYKKVQDANLVTQGLYYLDWIKDHKGDFEIVARDRLGEISVDWSHVRVLCIAPEYDKFALHAVKHMGEGIELWQYHLYENGIIELSEIYRSAIQKTKKSDANRVEGVKPKGGYELQSLLKTATPKTLEIYEELNDYILSLNDAIFGVPLKQYIAYKLAKNVVCLEVQSQKIIVTLNNSYREGMPKFARDVSKIGHWGTGNLELKISNLDELREALPLIRETYLLQGGD